MNINLSMDFLRPVAGALKKYTALLPSVIITIVAVLLFLPTMLLGKKISEKMEQSARTASSVQSLVRDVPSREESEQLKSRMDKFEAEVDRIKESAIESSRRDLIIYDYVIFPIPADPSSQIFNEFGQKYRGSIESLVQRINALDAPSDSEIQAVTGVANRTNPGMRGMRPMMRQSRDVQDPMVDALCVKRAQEVSVYANLSAFQWYDFWGEDKYKFSGQPQALQDCWDSQVAFWIYDDIIDTIYKINGTSSKVLTAPVKRLLGVSFTGPVVVEGEQRTGQFGGRLVAAGRDIPNYITETKISNFMDSSPTGRISNENIDVIHFGVSVIVDNRFILPFMKELCSEKPHVFYPSVFEDPHVQAGEPVEARHNQISILKSDLKVVDKVAPEHELYRYGKGAVMRLDLVCEYLFDRAAYDKIKPDPIKERLGQAIEETEESQQPGQVPGGVPGRPTMM